MPKTQVYVVHDETGHIVSIGRVSKGAKAIKLCGSLGQSAFRREREAASALLATAFVRVDERQSHLRPPGGTSGNPRAARGRL